MAQSKLLVVDDEPSLRMLLTEFLKKEFDVLALEGGRACLNYILENPLPQVLIVDLNMPDMSGIDVIKTIRVHKEWDSLAIIVLSAEESSQNRIACLKAGADDFVVKPFNPVELEARIHAILRRITK